MPHWELDSEVETGHRDKNNNQLNVNIVAIVVGALVVLTILAWVSAIKATCEHVLDDIREDRYDCLYRKYLAAVIVTLINAFIIAAIYIYVRNRN